MAAAAAEDSFRQVASPEGDCREQVDGDDALAVERGGGPEGERLQESAVRVEDTLDPVVREQQRHGATIGEVLPGDVGGEDEFGLQREHTSHDKGELAAGLQMEVQLLDPALQVAGIDEAIQQATGKTGPDSCSFRQGEPAVSEGIGGHTPGDSPTIEAADTGADDDIGLKASFERLPDSRLISAKHGSGGENKGSPWMGRQACMQAVPRGKIHED